MVRNLMMIFGLSLTVAAFGCSDDDDGGGGGGSPGCPNPTPSPVAPACDNAADLVELAACEPQLSLATACITENLPSDDLSEAQCATNSTQCLLDGNGEASAATTLSPECTACTAALACCITFQCSVVATPPGACVGQSGAGACDECIAEKCTPSYESCGEGSGGSGGGGSGGGSGGSGGSGSGGSGGG